MIVDALRGQAPVGPELPTTVGALSCRRIDEQHVDLTGSVMFEASLDLRRRFPFHWSTRDVGALLHVATIAIRQSALLA
ncbi:hypothetical protein [Rhodococcus sp. SB1D]|uniref:hypothetical protein n=1 Tax=Rhodococcus sp. SB1D TaxID=3404780 RepID=UPI003B20F146